MVWCEIETADWWETSVSNKYKLVCLVKSYTKQSLLIGQHYYFFPRNFWILRSPWFFRSAAYFWKYNLRKRCLNSAVYNVILRYSRQEIIYSSADYINKNSNINTECQNLLLTVWSKQNYSQTKQPACLYCQLMNMLFRKNIHTI